MSDAQRLARALTAAAIACLLAVAWWPTVPRVSVADVVRAARR